MLGSMTEREYCLPEWRIQLGQAGLCFMAALLTLVLVASKAPPVLWAIDVPIVVAIVWFAFARLPRKRVAESWEGLMIYSALTSAKQTIPWAAIERFEAMPGTRGRMVATIDKTGRRTAIAGLDAGGGMTWEEGEIWGEPEDLISELNERLAGWRRLDLD